MEFSVAHNQKVAPLAKPNIAAFQEDDDIEIIAVHEPTKDRDERVRSRSRDERSRDRDEKSRDREFVAIF